MKRLVEDKDGGLTSLLGKRVTFFCANYIYAGDLVGVNETCVEIENPSIVYETGGLDREKNENEQSLCTPTWFIQMGLIESFGYRG